MVAIKTQQRKIAWETVSSRSDFVTSMLFSLLLQIFQLPFSPPLSPYKRIPGSTRVTFRLSHSSSPGAKIHGAYWSNFARAKYPRPGENLLAWSELRVRTSAPSFHSGLYSPKASYGWIWASVALSFQLFSSPIFQSLFVFIFFFLKAITTAVNWILSTHELVFTCNSKNSIFGVKYFLKNT